MVEHDALNSTAGYLGRAKRIVQNKINKHTANGNTREFPVSEAMFADIHFDPETQGGGSKIIRGIYKHIPLEVVTRGANPKDAPVVTPAEDPCYFEVKIKCMKSGQDTSNEYNRGKILYSNIMIAVPSATPQGGVVEGEVVAPHGNPTVPEYPDDFQHVPNATTYMRQNTPISRKR